MAGVSSSTVPAHAPSQAHRRLQESKQLVQAQPALHAKITQLDAAAEALAQQQQAAGQTLEQVQVLLRVQHAANVTAVQTDAIQSQITTQRLLVLLLDPGREQGTAEDD